MNDSKNNENEKIPSKTETSNTENESGKDSGTCPIRPLDPPINVLDMTPLGRIVKKLFWKK